MEGSNECLCISWSRHCGSCLSSPYHQRMAPEDKSELCYLCALECTRHYRGGFNNSERREFLAPSDVRADVARSYGRRAATIASSFAVAFASIPLLVDFWKKPKEAPIWTYVAFTVANGISILAGKDWSVKERFYPVVCTVLTALFVVVAARRWSKPSSTVVFSD